MREVKILGTGCAKCEKLAELTRQAADDLGGDFHIAKVTDIMEITTFGVMITPALVVDGEVKVSGKVPSVEEIKQMLA